ncbi:DUF4338 domain-containing protein [Paenibacillus sp. CC-CFT747]|nr:DUF4338 domain-containing protein [Paenibacillus sp. CC-CFT747]
MDITTCGAIPPYSELLGGKLVSMLMASPQVIRDYYQKYKDSVSEIASRMKGEPLVRPANLVLLGTTSLYKTGSSQYNRIKIPVKHGYLKYIHTGQTLGYGSVHFSNRTYRVLQELLNNTEGLEQSSAFAAGVNYKMRSIGSGLGHLGLRKLQEHQNPRLVYLVPLAVNWREYLLGIDSEPRYLFDMNKPEEQTEQLIQFWKARWFRKRVENQEILYRIQQLKPLRVSDYFLKPEEREAKKFDEGLYQLDLFGGDEMSGQQSLSWRTLAQLKNQRASFAERLTPEELQSLHIETKMDTGFLNLLDSGKRLYLVGSPGDGKTHVIRKHIRQIEDKGIFYHLDASAIDEEALVAQLTSAIEENRPTVIAINEGPLRRLLEKLPPEEMREISTQLNKPFLYDEDDPTSYKALVINLGVRQVLSRSVLQGAFDTVLKCVDYQDAPLRIRYNQERLSRPRIKERMIQLLNLMVKNGTHITMHELLGFLAHVLTSGVTEPEHGEHVKPYYDAMFSSDSHLYRLLNSFDPAAIAHPLVDMWLYDEDRSNVEWLDTEEQYTEIQPLDYAGKKRRFYFEAKQGDSLLEMLPDDHRTFYDLLNNSQSTKQLAKRRILEALSSFFGQTGDEAANRLQIWTSLKYESKRDATVFLSSQSIPESMIDISVPRLREDVAGLIEFEPSHIRFVVQASERNASVGLNIDLDLWISLMKIKRGIVNRYQDPVIVRRLTTLMSQLAALYHQQHDELVGLQVIDTSSGSNHVIKVAYEPGQKGKYLW